MICSGYDEEKRRKIHLRSAETLEKGKCKGCKVIRNCAGGCVGQSVNETGDLYGIKDHSCKATKFLAEYLPINSGLYPCIHS